MDGTTAPTDRHSGEVETLLRLAGPDMAAVDALIRERMQSPVALIPALAEHLIAAGGKRIRPLITVAAARLAGTVDEAHLKLAAAVEFIHTATLLHDDIVDGSQMRRGKVAAHLIWGPASSVLVGDYLFTRAFELMVETGSLRALGTLAGASSIIAEGEVLQLMRAHDPDLTLETYLQIVTAKTAELFAAAAEAGAVAAGQDETAIAGLRAYGLNLGLAFQLIDDALDYGGLGEALGKNPGDDFREGKVTLPLLLAIQRSGAVERPFWDRAIGRTDQRDGDFARACDLMRSTGALAETEHMAQSYADAAKAALAIFADGEWKRALVSLADYAVARRS